MTVDEIVLICMVWSRLSRHSREQLRLNHTADFLTEEAQAFLVLLDQHGIYTGD